MIKNKIKNYENANVVEYASYVWLFFYEVSHTLVKWWNATPNILIKSLVRDDGLFHIHISRLNPQSYSVLPWKGDKEKLQSG